MVCVNKIKTIRIAQLAANTCRTISLQIMDVKLVLLFVFMFALFEQHSAPSTNPSKNNATEIAITNPPPRLFQESLNHLSKTVYTTFGVLFLLFFLALACCLWQFFRPAEYVYMKVNRGNEGHGTRSSHQHDQSLFQFSPSSSLSLEDEVKEQQMIELAIRESLLTAKPKTHRNEVQFESNNFESFKKKLTSKQGRNKRRGMFEKTKIVASFEVSEEQIEMTNIESENEVCVTKQMHHKKRYSNKKTCKFSKTVLETIPEENENVREPTFFQIGKNTFIVQAEIHNY